MHKWCLHPLRHYNTYIYRMIYMVLTVSVCCIYFAHFETAVGNDCNLSCGFTTGKSQVGDLTLTNIRDNLEHLELRGVRRQRMEHWRCISKQASQRLLVSIYGWINSRGRQSCNVGWTIVKRVQ